MHMRGPGQRAAIAEEQLQPLLGEPISRFQILLLASQFVSVKHQENDVAHRPGPDRLAEVDLLVAILLGGLQHDSSVGIHVDLAVANHAHVGAACHAAASIGV